ncbi:MAG: SPOR domain-containing protein [Acidobacteriaceae bacterium]
MSFLFDTEEEQEARKTERRSAPLSRTADTGKDTEIALGTRSLLGIFFGLVLICAVFFGLGYSVGRAGGSRAAVQPSADATAAPGDSRVPKPSPEQTLTPVETAPADSDSGTGPSGAMDNTLAPQPVSTQTQTPASTPVASSPARTPVTSPSATLRTPATPQALQPAPVPQPAAATAQTSFMVQVAAVRIQTDGDILVDALKKHGYTAVARHEPQDQLLHIQLGPFTSRADAMAMRAKLLADGYNAVVK